MTSVQTIFDRGIVLAETGLPVGTLVLRDGQRYALVGIRPHTRKDGSATWLTCWQTTCPDCQGEFLATAPAILAGREKITTRRCPKCAPGKQGKAVTAAGRMRQAAHLAKARAKRKTTGRVGTR